MRRGDELFGRTPEHNQEDDAEEDENEEFSLRMGMMGIIIKIPDLRRKSENCNLCPLEWPALGSQEL